MIPVMLETTNERRGGSGVWIVVEPGEGVLVVCEDDYYTGRLSRDDAIALRDALLQLYPLT